MQGFGIRSAKAINRAVRRRGAVYAERSFRPIWIGAGGPSPAASVLLETLAAAGAEGLKAADYRVAPLAGAGRRKTPASEAELDLALSAALVRYGTDLQAGRAVPKDFDAELFVHQRDVDGRALLRDAAAAGNLGPICGACRRPIRPMFSCGARWPNTVGSSRKAAGRG